MFIEPYRTGLKKGWMEVICGSMFSGKTEELIRRLKRARIAGQQVEIFKPLLDTRFSSSHLVSHDENSIPSTPVSNSQNILLLASDCEVVGIDEAQFFDHEIMEVCGKLVAASKRVIVAGLDMDFLGKPFEPMPQLMAMAEFVTKVHAICVVCGDLASHSFRKSSISDKVLLGEKDLYEPRCRSCFHEGMRPA
jgi:thymidine kinase